MQPMKTTKSLDPTPIPPWRTHDNACFFLLAVGLVLLNLIRPLSLPDEGRYAEIGRWMLISGDYLTPRLNGLPFFHKPPLLYWLDAGFFKIFGIHPWVARLVPTLHALIACGAVYGYSRRFIDLATARLAVIMLSLGLGFLGGAQYINHDMPVAAWITVTILAFAASLQLEGSSARRLAWIGFAASALAVLCKGMIGIALPGLVVLLWLLVTRRFGRIAHIPWFSGTLIFLLIAGPWFYLLHERYPDFLHYFFVEQQVTRYIGGQFNNRQGWWFYLVILPVLCFPWISFLPLRSGDAPSLPEPTRILAWIWCAVIVVFFSAPQSKLVGYIFPAIPPLAMIAAAGFPILRLRTTNRRIVAVGAVLFLGLMGYALGHNPAGNILFYQCLAGFSVLLWFLVIIGAWRRPQAMTRELGLLAVAVLTTFIVIAGTVGGVTRQRQSSEAIADFIRQRDPAEQWPVMTDGASLLDLPFYLNRHDRIIVLDEWQKRLSHIKDNIPQQLLDGTRFEPATGDVLVEKSLIPVLARHRPDSWLVVAKDECCDPAIEANYRQIGSFGNFQLRISRFQTDYRE